MQESISGEFKAKIAPERAESELPTVIAEGAVEMETAKTAEVSKEAEVIDVDKIMAELPDLDDDITKAHSQIRSYQTFAKKYADKPDILAKLNEESRQLQDRYDRLKAKRDGLAAQLKQARGAA